MKNLFIILLLIISLLQSGCYYDKHDVLNPDVFACDTAVVTYSGSVNPVFTSYCTGCHSGTNAPLGIKLDLYSTASALALNGRLFGSVTHSSGFSPMPKDGAKLSDCNIAKIKKWIDAGAPDN